MKKKALLFFAVAFLSVATTFCQNGATLTHYELNVEEMSVVWDNEISTSTVTEIAFDYGADGPEGTTDNFVIAFSGYFSPATTGDYYFELYHNDGCYLMLDQDGDGLGDADTVFAAWKDGQVTENTEGGDAITLTSGEYYEFQYVVYEKIKTTRGYLKWKMSGDAEYMTITSDELFVEKPAEPEEPEETNATSNNLSQKLQAYPNPASEQISLNLNSFNEVSTIRLYDIQGRVLVEMSELTGGTVTIPLSDFSSGLYMLEVNADMQVHVEKVLVK